MIFLRTQPESSKNPSPPTDAQTPVGRPTNGLRPRKKSSTTTVSERADPDGGYDAIEAGSRSNFRSEWFPVRVVSVSSGPLHRLTRPLQCRRPSRRRRNSSASEEPRTSEELRRRGDSAGWRISAEQRISAVAEFSNSERSADFTPARPRNPKNVRCECRWLRKQRIQSLNRRSRNARSPRYPRAQ